MSDASDAPAETKKRPRWRSCLSGCLVTGLLCAVIVAGAAFYVWKWGIYTSNEGAHKSALSLRLSQRRQENLQEWKDRKINGMPALAFAGQATALLVPLSQEWIIQESYKGDAPPVSSIATWGGGRGSAIPVTHDGYFLTCAHNVEKEPKRVFVRDKNNRIVGAKARVVWKGDFCDNCKRGHPDAALLHAEIEPAIVVPLRPVNKDDLRSGQPVLAAGWGTHFLATQCSAAAGNILEIVEAQDEKDWRQFHFSAFIGPGDSGGPVFNEAGELVGMNRGASVSDVDDQGRVRLGSLKGFYAEAVIPDTLKIQSLIEQDRTERKTASGSSEEATTEPGN